MAANSTMHAAAAIMAQQKKAIRRLVKRMKTRSLMLAMQLWLRKCNEVMRANEKRAREMQM